MPPARGARRAIWDVLVGIAAAATAFGAVPAVLVAFVGVPLPSHWDRTRVLSLHGLFDALAVAAWIAWAACAWPLLRSVAARVRARDATGSGAHATLRFGDRLALHIAAAVLAVASLVVAGATIAGATTAGATIAGVASSGAAPPAPAAPVHATTSPVGAAEPGPLHAVAVARRAEAGRFRRGEGAPGPVSPSSHLLPELAVLGTGALVAALLARRSRRAQRLRSFLREEGAPSWQPSEPAADLGTVLSRFEDVPLLSMVEAAVRAIGPVAAALDGDRLPAPELLRAGPDGVEIRFASVPPPAPDPWVHRDPRAWLLPASPERQALPPDTRGRLPWIPVLVPVGDDERGTWLLPIAAGASVSVIGPAAPRLVHAMVAAAEGWTWHEHIVITADPRVAAASAALAEERHDGSLSPRVLFTADPHELAPAVRRACAALVVGGAGDAEVSVLVDDRAATVHPLGLTVRPHLLDPSWSPAIAELTASESPPPTPAFDSARPDAVTARVRTEPLDPTGGAREGLAPAGGERVDVRLLAPTPWIEGLPAELPPKRARRAIELVAYLALHAPHPVTGDRLRTRVLGTADADAASKTLFNTVGAARRALGTGHDGRLLLPPASRTGHYCLSPSVTVDVRRCIALFERGRATADPRQRVALLEQALGQVSAEPLSGVLTGYGWWRGEGHERRFADAVVDGTCALLRVAVESRTVDLGRWALDKARLVEPYSEALTRGAMALAAVSGDARRLQREWEECRRQVDELDPGGVPSQATERLYARLRQHLRGARPADEPTAVLHA